jgi:hypothetical protein
LRSGAVVSPTYTVLSPLMGSRLPEMSGHSIEDVSNEKKPPLYAPAEIKILYRLDSHLLSNLLILNVGQTQFVLPTFHYSTTGLRSFPKTPLPSLSASPLQGCVVSVLFKISVVAR